MRTSAFARLYISFASGYLLSYLFRSVNAVISPDLTTALGLSPASLGLLTSAYFVAFAGMQIPAGMLLDRFGPRRVEPVLLALGAGGALCFALSDSLGGLGLGRALIGAGMSVGLMAPLKAIATWYPAERHASLSGWMMVAGGAGALLATTPVELALQFISWRSVFLALAVATLAAAALVFLLVPDTPRQAQPAGLRLQWRGVRSVFAHPRFWWLAPLAAVGMGSFMAIQGLWSVPWMIEVEGLSRGEAARHLLLMNGATLVGYLFLGSLSSHLLARGIGPQHCYALGFGTSALALAAIVARAPYSQLQWTIYGMGTAVNVLGFTVLNRGFARELTGRVNTALNLLMFGTSFAAQSGIGVIVEAARDLLGLDTAAGLRLAFSLVLTLYAAALAWFARGWKRHSAAPSFAAAAS